MHQLSFLFFSFSPITSVSCRFSFATLPYSSRAHCSIVLRGKSSLAGRGAKWEREREKEKEKTIEKGAWIARLGRATTFLIVDRLYSPIQPLSTRSYAHASICDSIVYGLQLASESFCRNWPINSSFHIFYKINKTFPSLRFYDITQHSFFPFVTLHIISSHRRNVTIVHDTNVLTSRFIDRTFANCKETAN